MEKVRRVFRLCETCTLNFLIRRLNSVEISTAREEDLLRKQNSSDEI